MTVEQQYILLATSVVLMSTSVMGLTYSVRRMLDRNPALLVDNDIVEAASIAVARTLDYGSISDLVHTFDRRRFVEEYSTQLIVKKRDRYRRVADFIPLAFFTLAAIASLIGIMD